MSEVLNEMKKAFTEAKNNNQADCFTTFSKSFGKKTLSIHINSCVEARGYVHVDMSESVFDDDLGYTTWFNDEDIFTDNWDDVQQYILSYLTLDELDGFELEVDDEDWFLDEE